VFPTAVFSPLKLLFIFFIKNDFFDKKEENFGLFDDETRSKYEEMKNSCMEFKKILTNLRTLAAKF